MTKTLIRSSLSPLANFIRHERSGGIALFASVLLALALANSPFSELFQNFWETTIRIGFMDLELNYTLHQWVNDGLMAMFFFVVGLELKREIMAGELASFRKALLPIGAALGGMLLPALLYILINKGQPSVSGWGIPMATDIVFSLALLGMVSKKVPLTAKIFLMALATVDDLGAVLVIAFFYSSEISLINLGLGLGLLIILIIANLLGVRKLWFYALIGIGGVWLTFLLSGVHATIAGVLVAFAIPAKSRIREKTFSSEIHGLLQRFDKEIPAKGPMMNPVQHQLIDEIKDRSMDAQAPSQKLEAALHPWVSFLVIPLFALSNSGVAIGPNFFSNLINPVTLGVVAGLIAGKFIGVLLFSFILVKTGIASLPRHSHWNHMAGIGLLAGVGFTMSLFTTNLAFDNPQMMEQAKFGILIASTISGTLGVLVLKSKKEVHIAALDQKVVTGVITRPFVKRNTLLPESKWAPGLVSQNLSDLENYTKNQESLTG